MKLVISIPLRALVVACILNWVYGIHFTGNFWIALYFSTFITFATLIADRVLIVVTATIISLTRGLSVAGIFFCLGWVSIPVIQLKVLAFGFPSHLAIAGLAAAVFAALALRACNFIIDEILHGL